MCRKPFPTGPFVFVTKYWSEYTKGFVPAPSEHYVVTIVGPTRTGKAERGDIRFSMSRLRAELLKSLKGATWYRDFPGCRHVFGGAITTPFGRFIPSYNSRLNSKGRYDPPSIWFTPDDEGPYAEVLALAHDHLFCIDEAEVARATNAPQEERISQDN